MDLLRTQKEYSNFSKSKNDRKITKTKLLTIVRGIKYLLEEKTCMQNLRQIWQNFCCKDSIFDKIKELLQILKCSSLLIPKGQSIHTRKFSAKSQKN